MKVNLTTKIRVNAMTAGALRSALVGIPDEATMSVYKYSGDPMDQREQPYTELTFSWSEER